MTDPTSGPRIEWRKSEYKHREEAFAGGHPIAHLQYYPQLRDVGEGYGWILKLPIARASDDDGDYDEQFAKTKSAARTACEAAITAWFVAAGWPSTEWIDADQPLPEDGAIKAAHPLKTGGHETYAEALRLVGAKRSKYALVDLVNYLLVQIAAHEDTIWKQRASLSPQEEGGEIADATVETACRWYFIEQGLDPDKVITNNTRDGMRAALAASRSGWQSAPEAASREAEQWCRLLGRALDALDECSDDDESGWDRQEHARISAFSIRSDMEALAPSTPLRTYADGIEDAARWHERRVGGGIDHQSYARAIRSLKAGRKETGQ